MDRLDALRLFVRVVESGSFSAVARENGVGQPAVSKQVAALEAHLGAQLVLRTSRQVTITEAGQAFYESALRLVHDFESACSAVGQGKAAVSGLVRMTTAPVLGRLYIVPMLARFHERHPDVCVELSSSERQLDLVGEGIDLALRHGPLPDSSLTARPLATSPWVTVATPAHLARHGTPATPADLARHPCIAFSPAREVRAWRFQVDGATHLHHPHGRFRTADAEQVRGAVFADLGMAHAPGWLFAPEVMSGQVVTVLDDFQPPPQVISLVHPAGRRLTGKVRALMDFIDEALPRSGLLS